MMIKIKLFDCLCFIIIVLLYSSTFTQSESDNFPIGQVINLGILIQFNDEISRAIRNETLFQLINRIEGPLIDNITTKVDLIDNFDDFNQQIEEDPTKCNNYMGLISILPCSSTKLLYSLIRDYCSSTLLISIHDRTCIRPNRDHGIGFPILSSVDHVVPMLIDMRHDFLRKWDHINLIHDDTIDIGALHDLVDGLSKIHGPEITPSIVTTYHIGKSTNSVKNKLIIELDEISDNNDTEVTSISQRETIKIDSSRLEEQFVDHITNDENYKHFIIIARSNHIREIIKLAHSKSLLVSPRKWLIIFSDNQENPDYWSQLSPILAASQTAIVIREASGYGQCNVMSDGCQIRLALETLRSSLIKVGLTTDYDFTDVDMKRRTRNRILTEIRSQLGSTESNSGQYCGNCDRYSLKMFERATVGQSIDYIRRPFPSLNWPETKLATEGEIDNIKITQTGEWTPFKGLIQSADPLPIDVVNGGGQVIKVGVINQRPLINAELIEGKCKPNGTTIELLKLIASRMNFTLEYICWSSLEDDKIGTPQSDMNWDGILGKLLSGEIDLAANGIWKTPSRIQSGKFEFLFPYDVDTVSLVVAKYPEDEKFLFICPFTPGTWTCVILCMIIIGPIFWIIHRSAIYYDYYKMNDGKGFYKLFNCVWYCYGAMVQQGGEILPQAISGRILIASWWLFVIVTVTTYSGNLVALLTFPKIIQPIQNAQDVKNSWGISVGASTDSSIAEMIPIIKYSDLAIIRDDVKYYDFNKERDEIFEDISDGDLAYIMKEYEARYWVTTEFTRTGFCGMHVAKDALYRTPVHMVTKKEKFPESLLNEINRLLFLMTRAGISTYWKMWFQTPGNDCMYPLIIHAGDVKKIDVIHMIGSYVLLAWGIGVGSIILIGEIVHKKCFAVNQFGSMKMEDGSKRENSGSSGLNDILRSMYTRYNSDPSYSKWASNVDYFNSSDNRPTKESKVTRLSFNHPSISRAPSTNFKAKANWASGVAAARAKASPNLYYDQSGSMYLTQIRGIYNDPENFQYPYSDLRSNYKFK